MTISIFAALLASAVSGPCAIPESMPPPSEMMAGEGDEDWCLAGADPFAVAGPDMVPPRQLVWQRDVIEHTVITQWRRGPADAPPTGWTRVFTRPAKVTLAPGALREVLIQRLGDNLIVVTANPAWRIGNAICSGEGGESIGYLPAGIEPSDADRAGIADMSAGLNPMDPGNILCVLMAPDGEGWRGSFRGPQGRPLPEIDDVYADMLMRLTPPGDFEQHLRFNR